MSYCVQCGVRLAEDLHSCPLCHTPVINPNLKETHKGESEQPQRMEEIIERMDRNYLRQLSVALMMIPILTVLLIDIIDGGVTWSPYAIGAMAMCWFFFVVPVVFRFKRPYAYVALDVLALCGYLALIAVMTDGFSWYLQIVLPLLVLLGAVTLLVMLVLRRLEMRKIIKGALLLLIFILFLVSLEVIIDNSIWGEVRLGWSVYSALPFAILAVVGLYVEHNKALKEEIRRRLFV